MHTTIILGHPKIDQSIANKLIINRLKAQRPEIEVRNIQALYPDYKIDVKAEQDALLAADLIVLQYPFYWYALPAILKHWLDEVLTYNFAYGSKGDKLKGKKFQLSLTIGAAKEAYSALGHNHFRIEELLKPMEQTAYLCQMEYLTPICGHGMVFIPGVYNTRKLVEERAAKHAQKLLDRINKLESESPA